MKHLDYDNSIAITRDIYWVGFLDKEADLHCNPYILIEDNEVILFDPGSIPHFPIVMRKVIDLVNPRDISIIVASHQDPDVCGNLAVVEDVIERQDLRIAAHGNSIRLIRHIGVRSEFYAVEENQFRLTLKSGRVLEFIHAPYLHSPGTILTYDTKTKTLFSGDLFGAVSKNWQLFASGEYLDHITSFHRVYMPSNQILTRCMKKLKTMDIQRILPQHGSILEGEQVQTTIHHLETLPCGSDLFVEKP